MGSIFKISISGAITTLHSFDIIRGSLYGALPLGSNGNFYGTTNETGTCTTVAGCETVFSHQPHRKVQDTYNFCQQTESRRLVSVRGIDRGQ
jgi:hypothetical protein